MRKVTVAKKILIANEEFADQNRKFLSQRKIPCLNVISSPGSGKTTILAKTIEAMKVKVKIGVIEGDIQTDIDLQRIKAAGAPAVQINTEGACHLSAAQISAALHKIPVDQLDLVIIENVGNLVCPSALDLGETAKIAVLSVPEGDDKPAKYPAIFSRASVVLINKTDLLGVTEFDIEKIKADILKLNREVRIFPVSAKTGDGMQSWYNWLEDTIAKRK